MTIRYKRYEYSTFLYVWCDDEDEVKSEFPLSFRCYFRTREEKYAPINEAVWPLS